MSQRPALKKKFCIDADKILAWSHGDYRLV